MTPLLLGTAVAARLMLLGGGAMAVRGGGRADRRLLARRLDAVAARPTRRVATAAMSLSTALPQTGRAAAWRGRLQRLAAFDPHVPGQPAWSCLVGVPALLAGYGVSWLGQSIVGPWAWPLLPLVALLAVRAYYLHCSRKWRTALFVQFPDALATVVRAVRVGVALPEAIRRVADEAVEPTAAIFARIADEMAIGTPLHEALAAATASTGLPEYRFFATALTLQARAGGGLAATLDGLADVIRKRVAVRARGKALAGEARASAAILAILPVFTAAALAAINPAYLGILFTHPTGHLILACACGTEGMGILAMRTLIRRALS